MSILKTPCNISANDHKYQMFDGVCHSNLTYSVNWKINIKTISVNKILEIIWYDLVCRAPILFLLNHRKIVEHRKEKCCVKSSLREYKCKHYLKCTVTVNIQCSILQTALRPVWRVQLLSSFVAVSGDLGADKYLWLGLWEFLNMVKGKKETRRKYNIYFNTWICSLKCRPVDPVKTIVSCGSNSGQMV